MDFPLFDHLPARGRVSGLPGAARGLFLLRRAPVAALAGTEEEARLLHADASFFAALLGAPPPLFLPAPEDRLTPERLAAVESLAAPPPVVIAALDAADRPVPRAARLRREYLTLREDDAVEPDFLTELLDEMGYRRALLVAAAGEFLVREHLVDVFPAAAGHPVRLEHRDGRLVSLRAFDVGTQRSYRDVGAVTIPPAREPGGGASIFALLDGHRTAAAGALPPGDGRPAPDLVLDSGGEPAGLLTLAAAGFEPPRRRRGGGEPGEALAALAARHRLLVAARSEGEASRVLELLREAGTAAALLPTDGVAGAAAPVVVTRGRPSAGFVDPESGWALVTGADLFGAPPARPRPPRAPGASRLAAALDDLAAGDPIVHVDHGIGRYAGLRHVEGTAFSEDLLELEFAGGAKLFLPPSQIDRIRRHHGTGSPPPLDRLGGPSWEQRRSAARRAVREMAGELLAIAAARESAPGLAFSPDTEAHRTFAAAFPFEETPDQLACIEEIRADMESPRPMDRLLCGDTGYGKTEVAMRAAFKAVADGRQVALLAPTTILVDQHLESFTERFAAFPVRIGALSRFTAPAEQRELIEALAAGAADIVIGTRRLLSRAVSIPRLGLLIVDEEQRFGVADKERIKELRAGVDVLTLTATPIPRTLHLALSGLRSLSLIESPPEERLAARAIVAPAADDLVREALERERARGGQAFVVHNRIETIHRRAAALAALVPGARLAVAHGRMGERELEAAMRRFHRGEADILLCTAIVGTGLDIPRANTIVVERADTFGLADLYQLKGRVGRADRRAFAYFLTPPAGEMTPGAEARLEAIGELSYLGAGFRLAMRDLELRGAGNILGAAQSGAVESVGYDLYLEMLREAVAELSGTASPAAPEPEVTLPPGAGIPPAYVDDVTLRFTLHRSAAAAGTRGAVADLRREWRDRFGPPPEPVRRLLDTAELRAVARDLGLARLEVEAGGRCRAVFGSVTPVPAERVLALPKRTPEALRFLPEGGFETDFGARSWDDLFERLAALLSSLKG